MTGCSSPEQGYNFATYSSFRCAYGNSLFLQLICTVRLLNTWNTFGCLALKIYCSPEGTRLPIRICFHSWFLNTNCTCVKLIFMCWFVMLITLTLLYLKSYDFSSLTDFSPVIYAKHALVSPVWGWKVMWTDLMCKYCTKEAMGQKFRGMWNNQQERMKIMLKIM